MNRQINPQYPSGIISDPDYVSPSNPTRKFGIVAIISIVLCWAVPEYLSGFVAVLGPVFWLVFHVLYIGLLVSYYIVSMKRYTAQRR